MSNQDRYTNSYLEQGDSQDAEEARLAARRTSWKRSRRINALNWIILIAGAVGFCAVMGYGIAGIIMGSGKP